MLSINNPVTQCHIPEELDFCVWQVLRNPEHEKEVKDDSNRGGGSKESRDKTQQVGIRKKEDDRHHNNRDKERERREKQFQENR